VDAGTGGVGGIDNHFEFKKIKIARQVDVSSETTCKRSVSCE